MNEELRNEETKTMDLVPENGNETESEKSSKSSVAIGAAVVGVVALGAAALLRKTKTARRNHAIKKLEKAGYTVCEPANQVEDVVDAEEYSESEAEETEE